MIVIDSGDGGAMQWRTVRRDLRRDWEEAFGGAMPPVTAIAVGADTDNTVVMLSQHEQPCVRRKLRRRLRQIAVA